MQLGSLLDYRFTDSHEWINTKSGTAADAVYEVGITDYAQNALGDIVFVSAPANGVRAERDESLGDIESIKSVSDLNAPLDLEVIEYNERINDDPGLINEDPYGEGWIFRARILKPGELSNLRDLVHYRVEVADEIAYVFVLDEANKIHYLPTVRTEDGMILSRGSNLRAFATGSLLDVSRLGMVDLADEFEELINKPRLTPAEIRQFLAQHPEFLLGNEYQELRTEFSLRPQVTLQEDAGLDLRPDFILRPVAGLAQDAKIVDLGLPTDPIAMPASAGGGLYDNMVEAVGRLRSYARYFDAQENRAYVQKTLGFTPYVPRLTIIVGQEVEVDTTDIMRNALRQAEPVEIVTYSDVLRKYRGLLD